jgi:hypothetical protein
MAELRRALDDLTTALERLRGNRNAKLDALARSPITGDRFAAALSRKLDAAVEAQNKWVKVVEHLGSFAEVDDALEDFVHEIEPLCAQVAQYWNWVKSVKTTNGEFSEARRKQFKSFLTRFEHIQDDIPAWFNDFLRSVQERQPC